MPSIHTLNARGNIMLPVMREHFSWSDYRTFSEIQLFHRDCLRILKDKGINYDELRSALTPQQDAEEAAFLFDEQRCNPDEIPGVDAANAIFKLLPPKTTHSILGGELCDDEDRFSRELLGEVAIITKDLNFKHPCFCYVIYVNNLSLQSLKTINDGLKNHSGYLGYVPCTFNSLAKTFVSMCLVNLVIKHKNTVILGHEDDRDNVENHNLHLHDYTVLGLTIKSLQSSYFRTFLSFKPQRMLLENTDDDLEIALRSMSPSILPLHEFSIYIDDKKFDHLKMKKLGILQNGGISHLSKSDLESAIRTKMRESYLYNLDWRNTSEYKASIFNVMLEFQPSKGYPERIMVALEYRPTEKVLRLITMT